MELGIGKHRNGISWFTGFIRDCKTQENFKTTKLLFNWYIGETHESKTR